MNQIEHPLPGISEFKSMFLELLEPEHRFYKLVLVYSIALSLLTLAIPISVQALIDTIANIALVRAIVVISIFLFLLMLISGLLYGLRAYVMELFNRRVFIRLASEMAISAISARDSGIDDRKRLSLFNRFFDIMTLKKNVPHVLTNGFSLILQSLIGFIVVSLYHLYFFLFAVVMILLIWLVWKVWGWRAIRAGFILSEAKYNTADMLQTLSISLRDFKATGNVEYILEEFNEVVNKHVDKQEKFFSFTFRQLISLLLINALASAVLLGMGGWLVIQGELTLGQLVAAELIMLGIFAGLPPLAGYLEYFYDICAAVEEISRFKALPQAQLSQTDKLELDKNKLLLTYKGVGFGNPDQEKSKMNFSVNPGEIIQGNTGNPRAINLLKNSVVGNIFPNRGEVVIGNLTTREINTFELRKLVKVIDRASVIPGSIRHYLMFSNPAAQQVETRNALELCDMIEVIEKLPEGIDTKIGADGWPLNLERSLRLKLAAAILSRPKILIIDQIYDLIDHETMYKVLSVLQSQDCSVLYFTQRQDLEIFTRDFKFNDKIEAETDRE